MTTLEEKHAAERAKADALCATDTRQANVLAELVRLDDALTADGFHPASPCTFAFKMYATPTGEVTSAPLVLMTSVLRHMEQTVGSFPVALKLTADCASSPDLSPHGRPMSPQVQHAVRTMLREHDVLPDDMAHYGFYGLGVCSEGLVIDENHPNAEGVLHGPDPQNHPDVECVFYTTLLTVDFRVWSTLHTPSMRTYATVGPDEVSPTGVGTDSLTDSLTAFMTSMV